MWQAWPLERAIPDLPTEDQLKLLTRAEWARCSWFLYFLWLSRCWRRCSFSLSGSWSFLCRVFFPRFVRIGFCAGESDKSVRGRLAKCISEWERINAPGFILEVIREGYKIPFVSLPPPKHGVNNLSAIKEADFVCEAILDLLNWWIASKSYLKFQILWTLCRFPFNRLERSD